MKKIILILTFCSFFSCKKNKEDLNTVLNSKNLELKITSIKDLTNQIYYTLYLNFDTNTIEFNYDDNRDIVIGEIAKKMGFEDKKGTIETTQESIEKFKKLIVSIASKTPNGNFLTTKVYIESEKGFNELVFTNRESYDSLVRFIQLELLKNEVQI